MGRSSSRRRRSSGSLRKHIEAVSNDDNISSPSKIDVRKREEEVRPPPSPDVDDGKNDDDHNEPIQKQDDKRTTSSSPPTISSSTSSSDEGNDDSDSDMEEPHLGTNDNEDTVMEEKDEIEAKDLEEGEEESTNKVDTDEMTAGQPSVTVPPGRRGESRLFSPYRTLGIVAGGPFHLLPNQNSSNAMVCAAIGERFHLMQCDRLHPVMVSHAVPGTTTTTSATLNETDNSRGIRSNPQRILHLVTDNSLSISVVVHGSSSSSSSVLSSKRGSTHNVTLFQRTRPTSTLTMDRLLGNSTSSSSQPSSRTREWSIVDLVSLGRIKMTMTGEKQDKKENAALIAVVLSKGRTFDDTADGVPVVGSDNDDDDDSGSSEDESDSDNGSSSSDEDDANTRKEKQNAEEYRGQVIILVASRTSLSVHKRIPLTEKNKNGKKLSSSLASFCPKVGIHPPTYVNKIILGGSDAETSRDAMILINVKTGNVLHEFTCFDDDYDPSVKSEITCLESSPAIDTIAVGNSKGTVHLINVRYDRVLFSLRHKPKSGSSNIKHVRITSMSFRTDGSALKYGIAPLAVGRSDGTITVWDLSPPKNENVSSDDEGDESVVGDRGALGRTVLCEMERVHYPGGVHKLQYMPQEPLLISTGTHSNALLMHIFDSPDHSGRILRQRRGHTAPPRCIRYLHPGAGAGGGALVNMADGTDAAACQILSGGGADRTLRKFSTVRSVLDKEFSQGKGLEKRAKELGMSSKTKLLLPPITAMSTCEMRSRDWGDLVTIHEDHAFAYVWSSKNGAQSGPVLRQNWWNVSAMKKQPPKTAHATSVTLSTCGNFALVGTLGGIIYKYNIQSGIPRGTYPINENDKKDRKAMKEAGDIRRTFQALEKNMKLSNRASNLEKEDLDRVERAKRDDARNAKLRLASHVGHAVTGIAVDSVNRTVISVGADAKLILWSFSTQAPHKRSPYTLPGPATKLCHVKDSDLAAIALEDYSAVLFDCTALNIVRRFGFGMKMTRHTAPISDLGFSPDGRTLYTSSLDGTIRVWDVPTNTCVDWLGFSSPPTSLTLSPTGEYLATTHTGRLGISLWSDRSFYQTVHVDGSMSLSVPASMDDPAPVAEDDKDDVDEQDTLAKAYDAIAREETGIQEEHERSGGPAKAKENGLITLSGFHPAHWKNLFQLELVKQRNKPKELPKKPPTAPFFLQWRPGVNTMGEIAANPEEAEQNKKHLENDEEWDGVWSDDDEDGDSGDNHIVQGLPPLDDQAGATKRSGDEDLEGGRGSVAIKRRKVTHYRSQLASLLEECSTSKDSQKYQPVTDYIGTLGPSAIDVSLSSLCNGMHDLEEGLPLLIYASQWLLEACESRERFDAVNAYLHRFLYLHSNILAGIDGLSSPDEGRAKMEDPLSVEGKEEQALRTKHQKELLDCVSQLKQAQKKASETLQDEMQNTLCLLRHFSRMV